MRKWRTRVIRLSDANEILARMESDLVKAYILSSSSPARLIIDGFLKIPKWIVAHAAEIYYLLLPLIAKAAEAFGDVLDIESRIAAKEKRIAFLDREIANLYSLTPAAPRLRGRAGNVNDAPTAAEIVRAIQSDEKEIALLRRDIEDLTKMLNTASNWLEMAMVAFSVVVVYLAVEKLLSVASSVADSLVALTPVREVRDAAINKAKVKALPQFPEKRTVVQKRSRRN